MPSGNTQFLPPAGASAGALITSQPVSVAGTRPEQHSAAARHLHHGRRLHPHRDRPTESRDATPVHITSTRAEDPR